MIGAGRQDETAVVLHILSLHQLRRVECYFHRISYLSHGTLFRIGHNADHIEGGSVLIVVVGKWNLGARHDHRYRHVKFAVSDTEVGGGQIHRKVRGREV